MIIDVLMSALFNAASDNEEGVVRAVAVRAGLLWLCAECDYDSTATTPSCEACGHTDTPPGDADAVRPHPMIADGALGSIAGLTRPDEPFVYVVRDNRRHVSECHEPWTRAAVAVQRRIVDDRLNGLLSTDQADLLFAAVDRAQPGNLRVSAGGVDYETVRMPAYDDRCMDVALALLIGLGANAQEVAVRLAGAGLFAGPPDAVRSPVARYLAWATGRDWIIGTSVFRPVGCRNALPLPVAVRLFVAEHSAGECPDLLVADDNGQESAGAVLARLAATAIAR